MTTKSVKVFFAEGPLQLFGKPTIELPFSLRIDEEAPILVSKAKIEILSQAMEFYPSSQNQKSYHRETDKDGCLILKNDDGKVHHERYIRGGGSSSLKISVTDAFKAEEECAFTHEITLSFPWVINNMISSSAETRVEILNTRSEKMMTIAFSGFSTVVASSDNVTLRAGRVLTIGLLFALNTDFEI